MVNTNGIPDFNVKYSGEKAAGLVAEIDKQLTEMVKAHAIAMNSYGIIKDAFTGSSEITAQFDAISTTSNDEVKKAKDNLMNIISGIKNINTSWEGVSAQVLAALKTYNGNTENGGASNSSTPNATLD